MSNSFKLSRLGKLVFVATLCFVPSAFLQTIGILATAYNLVRYAIAVPAMALWLAHARRRSAGKWMGAAACFYVMMFLSTLINGNMGLLAQAAKNFVVSVGFLMLLDMALERDYMAALSAVRLALEVLVLLNLVSLFVAPRGLYRIQSELTTANNPAYFLGHRNAVIEVLLPMLGLNMLESHLRYGKLCRHVYLFLGISLVTVLFTWSANSLVCMAFMAFYALYLYRRPHWRLFRAGVFCAVSAAASAVLTVFKLEYAFQWLIVNVLHRDMTLSKRTKIWEQSVGWIARSPLFGYGVETTDVKHAKIIAINSCHNYFLDLLYFGGVILLVITMVLFFMTIRRMYRRNTVRTAEVLAATMGGYFLLWIASPLHRANLCWMFMFWLFAYRARSEKPARPAARRALPPPEGEMSVSKG